MKTRIQCIALLSAVFLLACGAELPATQDATDSTEADLLSGRAGTVFTLSNDIASNDVLAFRRAADGTLQKIASYSTTGLGSGDGLGSQGALSLSGDRRFLFAVSAGSNELAVFSVRGEQLTLVDAVSTGGVRPVSVTEHDGLVYVLHAGEGHNDVTGFYQRRDGTLSALRGSTHALSGPSVGPAQVSFSPSGRALIVTEKMTDLIDELRVDASTGLISKALIHKSSGATPFGFATTQRGQVIVSEAHGGADNASTVSSYQLDGRAGLETVSAAIADNESAACWVVLGQNDKVAYTSNTKTGSISAYTVSSRGELALIGDGRSVVTGADSKPTDMALSRDERFLFVLESGTHGIASIRLRGDGSLSVVSNLAGLPASAVGLVSQ